jgi:hypothetical protein
MDEEEQFIALRRAAIWVLCAMLFGLWIAGSVYFAPLEEHVCDPPGSLTCWRKRPDGHKASRVWTKEDAEN